MSLTINNTEFQNQRRMYSISPADEVNLKLTAITEAVCAYLLPNGERDKNRWRCGNAYGDEGKSLAVELEGEKVGLWCDYGDGKQGGNLLQLWSISRGVDISTAIREAREWLGEPHPAPLPPQNKSNGSTMKEVFTWHYPEKDGITGKMVRKEDEQGNKQCFPYFHPDPKKCGIQEGFTPPLYGRTDPAYTFVVEGEKCVDALLQMGLAAVTSQGGSGSADKADWGALDSTEKVYLLPDNDEVGEKYIHDVAAALKARKPERELLLMELKGIPHKGDVVDWIQFRAEGWDGYSSDGRIPKLKDELRLVAKTAKPIEEPEKSGFQLIRASDIELTGTEWLVENLFELETVAWLYGDTEAFKTFVLLGICCSIAEGRAWGGRRTRKGVVVYICGEGFRGIRRRLQAWSNYYQRPIPPNLIISKTSTDLADEKAVVEMLDQLDGLDSTPLMICVDTFARNYSGEENANVDIGKFYNVAERFLVKRYGCTVVVTHHPGKNLAAGARGGASIKQNSDSMYQVERCDAGKRWMTKLHCEKMKDAEHPADITLEAFKVEIGVKDDYGNELTSLALKHLDPMELQKIEKKRKDEQAEEDKDIRADLLSLISKDGSLSQADYAARANITQPSVSRHIKTLRASEFIRGNSGHMEVTKEGLLLLQLKGLPTR